MAVMIRFSPMACDVLGPSNRTLIYTPCKLSQIATDNLTYQLLYYITTSTCATVSSHILSYAAIYGYTALQVNPKGYRDFPMGGVNNVRMGYYEQLTRYIDVATGGGNNNIS